MYLSILVILYSQVLSSMLVSGVGIWCNFAFLLFFFYILTISPCRNFLAACCQPFVEPSVWMIIWILVAEFSSHCKASSFPATKGVPPLLNCPVSHDHCRTNIRSCWRYQNWIRAGKMPWTVDDNRSVDFVRFKTEVLVAWKSNDIVEAHAR